MILRRAVLVFQLCVLITAPAWAENQIIAGVNYRDFDYREDPRPPLKSTEHATFFAPYVRGKFGVPSLQESFVSLLGEISGNVSSTFDGTDLDGNSVKATNALSFADVEASFYWNVAPDFFVQAGLGYHYWNRFLSGNSGYREIYTWYVVPLGILYQTRISDRIRLGVDLTYRLMFQGQMELIFSETVTNGDDTTFTLGDRPGYKLQVPLEYDFEASNFGMALTPWYEFSEIGASDSKYNSTPTTNGPLGNVHEPASQTQQYGLQIGAKFRF